MTDVEVEVACAAAGDGWVCSVRVRDDLGATEHEVTVRPDDVATHGVRSVDDAERLVRETFEFLLEREPKESILRTFDLDVVRRYFAEYPEAIRIRLAR